MYPEKDRFTVEEGDRFSSRSVATAGQARRSGKAFMRLRVKHPIVVQSVRMELSGPTELRLDGSIRDEGTDHDLRQHLQELHAYIVTNKLASLIVDIRKLAFVNSSAIRLFVDMASRAQNAGYTIIFDIDSSVTWQRLSFSVLKSLAPDCVVLRNDGRVTERLGA
jgi:hypothetical protein